MKKLGLLTLLIMMFSNVSAAETSGLMMINADFGGDTLVDITYTDGSTADIDAGRGITLGGGVNWNLSDDFILQTTAAWKFTTIPQASNGDLTWTRIPLEAIAYYNIEKLRIGAGVIYHMSNRLKGTGFASGATQDFDNALGTVVGFEYLMTPGMSINVRYTMISYTPAGTSFEVDGNSIGLGVNFYFSH